MHTQGPNETYRPVYYVPRVAFREPATPGYWCYDWNGTRIGPFSTEESARADLVWHLQHPDDYYPVTDTDPQSVDNLQDQYDDDR